MVAHFSKQKKSTMQDLLKAWSYHHYISPDLSLVPFCGVWITTNLSIWKLKAIFSPTIFGGAC
jgi:hypothetical protein